MTRRKAIPRSILRAMNEFELAAGAVALKGSLDVDEMPVVEANLSAKREALIRQIRGELIKAGADL